MATKVNAQGLETDLVVYLEDTTATAAAPSLSFTGSTNTGIFRNSGDSSVNLSLGGTVVAKFTSTGIGLLSSTNTIRADFDFGYVTDGLVLPSGTTAQRLSTTPGTIRYNTTNNILEYRDNSGWATPGKTLVVNGENYLTLSSGSTTDTITANAINLSGSNVTNTLPTARGGTGRTDITSTEYGYLDNVTSNIQTQLNSKQATITGAATTIVSSNLTSTRVLVSDGSGKVSVSVITSTELGHLDNVTSNIQTQLNNLQSGINSKQDTITGAATTVVSSDLATNRVVISNGSGKIEASTINTTKLGYLNDVTSNIQTQLNDKAALNSPNFTGTPTAPTQTDLDTTNTQIATTAFVNPSVTNLGIGTTENIDAGTSDYFYKTTSDNTTVTFSAVASGIAVGFILELTLGGAHVITFPVSVQWANGQAPTLNSGTTNLLGFITRDGGTTWYGSSLTEFA